RRSRQIRIRIEGRNRPSECADAVLWNDVPLEWLAPSGDGIQRGRIIDDEVVLRKISGLLGGSRHRSGAGYALTFVMAFVTEKEKRAILLNRSAQRGAILIAAEFCLVQVEKVSRIEHIVAHKLVSGAMHLVRSRLGNHVDLGAGASAERGGVGAGLDFE